MANRRKQQSGCAGRLMSLAAALLLLLSIGIVALIVLFFVAPDRLPAFGSLDLDRLLPELAVPQALAPEEELPTLVAAIELPTNTPTPTEPPLDPTWTPPPVGPSATPLPFSTLKPSVTPSPLPTFPTKTPTPTYTPTATNTPTATPLGPTATPSPLRARLTFLPKQTTARFICKIMPTMRAAAGWALRGKCWI
ncbi:MAG: hypothetical protein R3D55_26655 [Chloroflexota bacterium]